MTYLELFESTKRLIELLSKTTSNPKKHILYPYIIKLDEFLGSSQDIIEDMSDFLGFSYNLERYDQVKPDQWGEGITLREVIYYELWYYLKYVEPNLKKLGLKSTEELIYIKDKEFEKIFFRLYPKGTYDNPKFKYRLSTVSDYAQQIYASKII